MEDNTNIFFILNQIFSSNGEDKNSWKNLLLSLNNISSYEEIIHYFNQKLINNPSNSLTLDILDFMIDNGPITLLRELSKIDLMINVFNLLKKSSGSTPEVQKQGIYLTKKWFEFCNKYRNENFEGFSRNYYELIKKGIAFPPSGYKLNTYDKYISNFEINKILSNRNQNMDINEDLYNNFRNISNSYVNNNFKDINNNNNFVKNNTCTIPFEKDSNYDNNNDIPSNDMPQLLKNQEIENGNNMNNINNDIKDNQKNNKQNPENFGDDNIINNNKNLEKENIHENPFDKLKAEDAKFPDDYKHKFSDLKYSSIEINNKEQNIKEEKSIYPEYPKNNEKDINNNVQNKNNIINLNENPYSEGNNDININNSTPFGNQNKMIMRPKPNNNFNTIYNNEFKDYIEKTYGNNNGMNNMEQFNDNFNNHNNNGNENQYNVSMDIYNMSNNINNQKLPDNSTFLYKHSWCLKLSLYNNLMDKNEQETNKDQLKQGIKEILNESEKIESLLQRYNKDKDFESINIILKLKSDMNQTCHRFERYVSNLNFDKFYSAFEGNNKEYTFNREYITLNLETKEPNKYVEGLKKIGGVMKKGIFTAGKVVKDNTVKGINFVKEKVHKDKIDDKYIIQNNNESKGKSSGYDKKKSNINNYTNSSDFNFDYCYNYNNNYRNNNNQYYNSNYNNINNNNNNYNNNYSNYNYNNNNFNNNGNCNNNNNFNYNNNYNNNNFNNRFNK